MCLQYFLVSTLPNSTCYKQQKFTIASIKLLLIVYCQLKTHAYHPKRLSVLVLNEQCHKFLLRINCKNKLFSERTAPKTLTNQYTQANQAKTEILLSCLKWYSFIHSKAHLHLSLFFLKLSWDKASICSASLINSALFLHVCVYWIFWGFAFIVVFLQQQVLVLWWKITNFYLSYWAFKLLLRYAWLVLAHFFSLLACFALLCYHM